MERVESSPGASRANHSALLSLSVGFGELGRVWMGAGNGSAGEGGASCAAYEDYPPLRALLIFAASAVAALGVLSNTFLLLLFSRRRKVEREKFHYLTALALMDVWICVVYVLLFGVDAAAHYFVSRLLYQAWYFYVVPLLQTSGMVLFIVPQLLMATSWERFILTTNHLKKMTFFAWFTSPTWRRTVLTLLFVVSGAAKAPGFWEFQIRTHPNCSDLLGTLEVYPTPLYFHPVWKLWNFWVLQVLQFFVSFGILFCLNLAIIRNLFVNFRLNKDRELNSMRHPLMNPGEALRRRLTQGSPTPKRRNSTRLYKARGKQRKRSVDPLKRSPTQLHKVAKGEGRDGRRSCSMGQGGAARAGSPFRWRATTMMSLARAPSRDSLSLFASDDQPSTHSHSLQPPGTVYKGGRSVTRRAEERARLPPSSAAEPERPSCIEFSFNAMTLVSRELKRRSTFHRELREAGTTTAVLVTFHLLCNSLSVVIKFLEMEESPLFTTAEGRTTTTYTVLSDLVSFFVMLSAAIRLPLYLSANLHLRHQARKALRTASARLTCSFG